MRDGHVTCAKPLVLAGSLDAENSSAKTQSTPVPNAAAVHRPTTVAFLTVSPEAEPSFPELSASPSSPAPPVDADLKEGARSSIKADASSN